MKISINFFLLASIFILPPFPSQAMKDEYQKAPAAKKRHIEGKKKKSPQKDSKEEAFFSFLFDSPREGDRFQTEGCIITAGASLLFTNPHIPYEYSSLTLKYTISLEKNTVKKPILLLRPLHLSWALLDFPESENPARDASLMKNFLQTICKPLGLQFVYLFQWTHLEDLSSCLADEGYSFTNVPEKQDGGVEQFFEVRGDSCQWRGRIGLIPPDEKLIVKPAANTTGNE